MGSVAERSDALQHFDFHKTQYGVNSFPEPEIDGEMAIIPWVGDPWQQPPGIATSFVAP